MGKFVIDCFAWIEYFEGSKRGEKVKEIVENGKNEIFTNIITFSEVMSVTRRRGQDPETAAHCILLSGIVSIDIEMAKSAGLFHAETKKKIADFGLADAYVASTAQRLGAHIVTGDPHFKNIDNVVMI